MKPDQHLHNIQVDQFWLYRLCSFHSHTHLFPNTTNSLTFLSKLANFRNHNMIWYDILHDWIEIKNGSETWRSGHICWREERTNRDHVEQAKASVLQREWLADLVLSEHPKMVHKSRPKSQLPRPISWILMKKTTRRRKVVLLMESIL